MNYYFIFILFVIVLIAILILAIVYAIRDMKKISPEEIQNLSTGDNVTIKTELNSYVTGRIIFLQRSSGHGILKPKDHIPIDFKVSQIRSLS